MLLEFNSIRYNGWKQAAFHLAFPFGALTQALGGLLPGTPGMGAFYTCGKLASAAIIRRLSWGNSPAWPQIGSLSLGGIPPSSSSGGYEQDSEGT